MSLDQVAKAITGTKAAIDVVAKMSDLAMKSAQLELQENVAELRGKLLDVKESLLEVREENIALREEVKRLKNEDLKLEIEQKEDLFYASGIEQPVCYNCSMEKSRPIVLSRTGSNLYKCSICNAQTMQLLDPKSASNCF